MAIRRRKSSHRLMGPPEAIAGALFLLLAAATVLTLRANLAPRYVPVPGTVVHAKLVVLPYSKTGEPGQVHMDYAYRVEGRQYTGHFAGYWPQAGSLNALPRAEWPRLTEPGCALTVMVDPLNPGSSLLHHEAPISPQMMNGLALVALVATLYYLLRIYPRWKRRSA